MAKMFKLITTSWDDGHPQDFKLAELLDKYSLPGTFYIPKQNAEHEVMAENCILQLSKRFEIGGHTLNHVRLYPNKPTAFLKAEIEGCFAWLSDLLGYEPISFCFPGGVVNKKVIELAQQAGFKVLRTTELLSTGLTSTDQLQPTTVQVFDHPKTAFLKNMVKRSQYKSLLFWLRANAPDDIFLLVDIYLAEVSKNGGCFHLWGHSWEIEEYNLWHKLELIFARIAGHQDFEYVQNKDLVLR